MKKLIVILLIAVVLFLGGITYYKFGYKNNINSEDESFVQIDIDKKNIKNEDSKTDKETYSSNIINDIIKTYDYKLETEKEGITGKIYIDNNNKLHITCNELNTSKRLSNVDFKTMYYTDEENIGILLVYLISNDNKLYMLSLTSTDIEKTLLKEVQTSYKVMNFTNLTFNMNEYSVPFSIIVLGDDDNMYEPLYEVRYNNTIKMIDNTYYVYGDNTIANIYGNMLRNNENDYYKIKYYIYFTYGTSLFPNTESIIITDDNKIIYLNSVYDKLYIYNKTIKKLSYELTNNYNEVKLKIELSDNSKINVTANYTNYYGFD